MILLRSLVTAILATGAGFELFAATITWQGGDGVWTAANWNINGIANQTLATPPTVYVGNDFVFSSDDLITSTGRPALDGGSWTQMAGTVDLTGGGNNSGASFGHNGTASTVILAGNAALVLTGSGGAGTAMSGRVGTMTLSNNASVTCNNKNFEIRNGFAVSLNDDSSLTAPYIDFSTSSAANALLTLVSGTVTLTGNDPVQTAALGSSPPGNRINFTGSAGAARLLATDNSDSTKNLANKLATGFFCIDGQVVTDTSTFVAGRRFNISTAGSTDTLVLTTNPPGGSLVLKVLDTFPEAGLARNPPSAGGTTNAMVSSGYAKAQTLFFPTAITLSNLVVQVDDAVPSSDLTGVLQLEIYPTLNNLPFGGARFSDGGSLPAGLAVGDFLEITLPNPLVLPRGRYAVVLSSSDASVNFKVSLGDAYSAGALLHSPASHSWAVAVPGGQDLVFAALGSEQPGPPVPTNRPNIVVILADDMSWTDIQTLTNFGPNCLNGTNHGSDYYQTPNIARLAREGLSFTHCYAQPNCSPMRAAILSGQYASRSGNGVYNVDDLNRGTGTPALVGPAQNEDVPSSTVTSAESLRAGGYVTAHFGKFHVGGHEGGSSTLPLNQGFDWNFGGSSAGNPGSYFASGGAFAGNVGPELDAWAGNYTADYINTVLWPLATNRAANPNNPSTLLGTPKHVGDAMADAALAFLNDHVSGPLSNRPFYIQFHTYEIHTPIQPRPDLVAKYNALPPGVKHTSSSYAGLVESQDQQVGRILDFLDDPNGDGDLSDSLVTNTVVFFTSDNGGHEGATDNAPLRARKGTHYEGGIRVPLIVRQTGTIPGGQMTDTMVHAVDFYPTFLDLSGAPAPAGQILDGTSLAAHLTNPMGNPRNRGPIFYHFPGYLDQRARPCSVIIKEIQGKRYKLIYNYDLSYDPVPTDDAIKVLTQPWELYNLTDDLGETKNLIDGTYSGWLLEGAVADELASDLVAWLTQTTPGWNAKQPTVRSTGASVPYPPASVPDVPPPGGRPFLVTTASFDQSSHQVTLTWNSENNFRYSIWGSSNLQSWSMLLADIVPTGSNTSQAISDSAIETGPRYYRVGVRRP